MAEIRGPINVNDTTARNQILCTTTDILSAFCSNGRGKKALNMGTTCSNEGAKSMVPETCKSLQKCEKRTCETDTQTNLYPQKILVTVSWTAKIGVYYEFYPRGKRLLTQTCTVISWMNVTGNFASNNQHWSIDLVPYSCAMKRDLVSQLVAGKRSGSWDMSFCRAHLTLLTWL
ncbi:hypothetical protein TNCV_3525371 [Trichonephila clavipes]|uniref:Uncharacterized protein n=1 Tax=Trichonephila clavipes TaxID=2585209 RepID=A0A8X6SDX0_TRICX|nr:hypothetical protein TNCV_3525371 [Trichonephila clavipes]